MYRTDFVAKPYNQIPFLRLRLVSIESKLQLHRQIGLTVFYPGLQGPSLTKRFSVRLVSNGARYLRDFENRALRLFEFA